VLQVVGSAAASFGVTLLAILALRPVAIAVDLVDRPGGRKIHYGEVPVIGGLAMFVGLVLGMGLLKVPGSASAAFIAACAILVTIGLVDDRFNLSPFARLPGHMAASAVIIFGSGTAVTTLGHPLGGNEIVLGGYSSIAFTILITTAAINAFNMLDGMDGLAGATSLIALIALAWIAWTGGAHIPAAFALVLAASVCAFLIFNLPVRFNRPLRCFMGDAGSTLLGFSVAWLCMLLSQGPGRSAAPVTILWLVALPLFELLWSTLRRILLGVSPFKADADHFHHLLLKAGFSVRGAFAVFVLLSGLLAAVGLVADHYGLPDAYSLLLLIAAGVGTVRLMYRADIIVKLLPDYFRHVAPLIQTTTRSET